MPEGPGFLEFFILEASDYVEQLDGLLLAGGTRGGAPDADALQRVARALRGTATMAKLTSFADLAGAVERVGRSLHERNLQWDPALGGALIAAIDDLKTLLHAARAWSPTDDRRAITRSAELSRYAPSRPVAATTEGAPAASAFLATEAANIAAGLELLTTRAGDADTAANVLKRIRALRGVAGVKEVGPLADALEATEETGRVLESGRELSAEGRRLLETAAAYLRTLASALRGGGDVNAANPARETFEAAREALTSRDAERERVVPIADLFYTDGAAGLVEAAQHPPTTVAERFRLELVSLGEHLRQVVDAARAIRDPGAKVRMQRELRRALGALDAACQSFGEHEIADFIRAHGHAANNIDFLGLSALDDLASLLAKPGAEAERLRTRLREITGSRDMATAIGAGFGHETPRSTPPVSAIPAVSAPAARPSSPPAVRAATPPATRATTPPRAATPPAAQPPVAARPVEMPRPKTPAAAPIAASAEPARRPASVARSTQALDSNAASLIDSSIAALESFSTRSLLPPRSLDEEQGPVVPIESLLYRGRAALDRAVEVRDRIRQFGPESDPDALDELMDLVELARAE